MPPNRLEDNNQTFWAAPDIAKAGYPVFPLSPKEKAPSVSGGFYAATKDVSEIAGWIQEGRGTHDIGMPTGLVSGVVVIEADTRESLSRMTEKCGTPTVETRRGAHWWFRHPRDGRVVSRNVEAGLDCKGDGGYVAVPPSTNKSWTNGIPNKKDLPTLPKEFRGKVRSGTADYESEYERGGHQEQLDRFVMLRASAVIAQHVSEVQHGKRHEHLQHMCGVLLPRMTQTDAQDILTKAWQLANDELATRAPTEVPNTLRTTAAALAEERATGVPRMEQLTPGLYEALAQILGWQDYAILDFGSKREKEASEAGSINPLLAKAVDLADALENGIDPPAELEPGLLLEGMVHHVFAPAGVGKTFLALWLANRCLQRGQKVLYLDEENGPYILTDRLHDLDVKPDLIRQNFCYLPLTSLSLDIEDVANFRELIGIIKPDLVIFDSLIKFLSSAGLQEDSNDDVARWFDTLVKPVRSKGITSLVLDHVPHDAPRSRGASRKKDEVDVQYHLVGVQPFNRTTVGEIKLKTIKDRLGWLPEETTFSVGGGGDGFIFSPSKGTVEEPGAFVLKDTERIAYDTLVDNFGYNGARYNKWKKVCVGKGKNQMGNGSFGRAVKGLTRSHLVEQVPTTGGTVYKPANYPSGPTGNGTDFSAQISLIHERSQQVPNRSHGTDGTGEVPQVPHPLRGGTVGPVHGTTEEDIVEGEL